MLRNRMRTHPSTSVNTFRWLCLKYPNQPLRVGLMLSMMVVRLLPLFRFVFARSASLSFFMLFFRGQR